MAKDEDQAWLDRLAGRKGDELSDRTRAEADAVRKAILDRQAREAPATATETQAQLEKLLFRLRREKLLEASQPAARRWVFRSPLAAAAMLVIAVGVAFVARELIAPPQDPVEMRGIEGPQTVRAADIEKTANEIATALTSAGATVREYPLGLARGIEATIPRDRRAAVLPAITPFGLKLPADDRLVIEVRSSP